MQSRRVQHGGKYKGSMLHAIIYKATTQCDKHTEQCEKTQRSTFSAFIYAPKDLQREENVKY